MIAIHPSFVRYIAVLLCVLFISAVSVPASLALAQDWPQWRGPGRDGVALDARLPAVWPNGMLRTIWRVPIGDGYSAPVVVADRLYTHAREKDNEVVLCLGRSTGKELWRYPYPAPYKMHPAATAHGPGPKATTTVADGKVYAFGISSILTCLDADTGKLVWQLDPKKQFEAEPAEYGTAGSPLVDGDLVVVPVGGKQGGAVMAFDNKTGKMVWKAVPGELPAMSSPLAADMAGVRHILTFSEKQFVGLEAGTGKVLWSYPFQTEYRQNIVTPLVVDDLVIASGINQFAFALRVTRRGQEVIATEAWRNRDLRIYMSSPVAVNGFIYGQGVGGVLVCVEAKTGKTIWLSERKLGKYCSIVVAGDRLLVLADTGELIVVKADPSAYQETGHSQVSSSETWSHLALVGSEIFVRDKTSLAAIELAPAECLQP